MLGIGLGYSRRSRSLGGRAAQHVEADPAGGPMVPRRQSASVAALFAVPRAATESANGGASDAGLRLADGSSRELSTDLQTRSPTIADRVYSGSGYAFGFSRNAVKAAFASGERSARENSPSSASICA